jgi:hypothetical protein
MEVPVIYQGDSFGFQIVKWDDEDKTQRTDLSDIPNILIELKTGNSVFARIAMAEYPGFSTDGFLGGDLPNGEFDLKALPSETEKAQVGDVTMTLKFLVNATSEWSEPEIIARMEAGAMKTKHYQSPNP